MDRILVQFLFFCWVLAHKGIPRKPYYLGFRVLNSNCGQDRFSAISFILDRLRDNTNDF